jgi:tRNA1(Val) A37 N6-methylase TrmN6
MEPKFLRFVHPSVGKKPSMILIEASKCGGKELKVMEPLYVYNDDGSYSDEIMKIYYGGQKNE